MSAITKLIVRGIVLIHDTIGLLADKAMMDCFDISSKTCVLHIDMKDSGVPRCREGGGGSASIMGQSIGR